MQYFGQSNVATDEGNGQHETCILNKKRNCSDCTMLTLSTIRSHRLIAQLVRVSIWNSVVWVHILLKPILYSYI